MARAAGYDNQRSPGCHGGLGAEAEGDLSVQDVERLFVLAVNVRRRTVAGDVANRPDRGSDLEYVEGAARLVGVRANDDGDERHGRALIWTADERDLVAGDCGSLSNPDIV